MQPSLFWILTSLNCFFQADHLTGVGGLLDLGDGLFDLSLVQADILGEAPALFCVGVRVEVFI